MKKKILSVILVIAFAVVGVTAIVGTMLQLKAKESTETETTSTTKPMPVVAIDDEKFWYGELTIFNDGQFFHENNVIDYVKGDPRNLVANCRPELNSVDVVGIYAVQENGSNEVTNKAVLANGLTVTLDTHLHRLPQAFNSFEMRSQKEGFLLIMSLNLDSNEYSMTIQRLNNDGVIISETINHVIDAAIAYDTIYWMVGDTVYSLDWLDLNAEPEVFFKGAIGVSHYADEAEGALVPTDKANYEAYGRYDIFSPYGK